MDTTLIYRVIIMIRKEIWHGMRAYKATFFIKGYRQRAVAGSHLQYRKLSAVFFNKKFNQRFGIAFSLKWGNCSDILNFKYYRPSPMFLMAAALIIPVIPRKRPALISRRTMYSQVGVPPTPESPETPIAMLSTSISAMPTLPLWNALSRASMQTTG